MVLGQIKSFDIDKNFHLICIIISIDIECGKLAPNDNIITTKKSLL